MLTKYTKRIFNNYKSIRDKKEEFEGHPMAKLIKEDFREYLKDITPNSSDYKLLLMQVKMKLLLAGLVVLGLLF